MIERLQLDVWILVLLFMIAAKTVSADVPTLTNLTEKQTKTVVKDFGANFVHTSVSPASTTKGFGLEIGALAGLTQSPGINEIVEENYGYIPNVGAIGILYLPAGFGAEYLLVPKTVYQGLTFQNNSVALRWTPTEIFSPSGFLQVRLRGFYGDAQLSYSQKISNQPVNVGFRSFSKGGDIAFSFQNIPFIEPYATLGVVSLDSRLKGEGTASMFDLSYTTSQQVQVKQSGSIFSGGFVLKLPLFVAGAEYAQIAGDMRISVKLALQFSASGAKKLK